MARKIKDTRMKTIIELITLANSETITGNMFYGLKDADHLDAILRILNRLAQLVGPDFIVPDTFNGAEFDAAIDRMEKILGNDFSEAEMSNQGDALESAISVAIRYGDKTPSVHILQGED